MSETYREGIYKRGGLAHFIYNTTTGRTAWGCVEGLLSGETSRGFILIKDTIDIKLVIPMEVL